MFNLNKGYCTLWFDSAFGVDWSLSCGAHDQRYDLCDYLKKLRADLELTFDVWAVAGIAAKWWQRGLLRVNAVAMGLAVFTVGNLFWIKGCVMQPTKF